QLVDKELELWILQVVMSNPGAKMSLRKSPRAFTEHGGAMLSSVLRSPRAIATNVAIMRTFVRMREVLAPYKELDKKLDALERRMDSQDETVVEIVQAIRQLMTVPPAEAKPKRKIGFV
ncbi:MAG: ORF6N domain-containing protein, partial [Burkholderiales bacterium]